MSILDAVSASIADPFVYSPAIFTTTNPTETQKQVAVISGYMHAAPPTYVGLGVLFDKLSSKYRDPTTERFLITEVGLDYKQAEEKAPRSIASWTSQFSSLIYTNKINASIYVTDMLFKKHNANYLPLRTPFGELDQTVVHYSEEYAKNIVLI